MTAPVGDNRTPSAERLPLLAVEDDRDLLREVEHELRNRDTANYRVCCLGSADEAVAALQDFAAAGEQVALVLAGEVLDGAPGTDLLAGDREEMRFSPLWRQGRPPRGNRLEKGA